MKTCTWLSTLMIVGVFAVTSSDAWGLIRIGAEGGLSMASLSSNTTTIYSTRTGLLAGGILEIGFNDFVSIQIEGNYVQKGSTTGIAIPPSTAVPTLQYDYFAVPVYLKFTADLPVIKPFIGIGPYLAFSINAQSVSATGFATTLTTAPGTDFGVSGILGAEFPVAPVVSLFVDLRYDMGFTDLDPTALTTVRTRAFIIGAGVFIGI